MSLEKKGGAVEKVCRVCGSSEGVRRDWHYSKLYKCRKCRDLVRRNMKSAYWRVGYDSQEEARRAYNRNRKHHTCKVNLPSYETMECLYRNASMRAVAREVGLSATAVSRIYCQYFKDFVERPLFKFIPPPVSKEESQARAIIRLKDRFDEDSRFALLWQKLDRKRMSLDPVICYNREKPDRYSTEEVLIKGYRFRYFRLTRMIKIGHRLYWRCTINPRRFDELSGLVFELINAKGDVRHLVVPIGALPQSRQSLERMVVAIPVRGWSRRQPNRQLVFDWWVWEDRFDLFKIPAKKKMAAASLPEPLAQRSVV